MNNKAGIAVLLRVILYHIVNFGDECKLDFKQAINIASSLWGVAVFMR